LKAAYAGIATRNRGLNDLLGASVPRIAINSLAAAYVLTREPVSGTVPSTDVRASIGVLYIVFMILPLLFMLPLLGFTVRGAAPGPVPRSVWDILVLARGDNNIPQRGDSNDSYPPRNERVAFGVTISEEELASGKKLGFGESFVPWNAVNQPPPHEDPIHEPESDRHEMPSKNEAPKQEQPMLFFYSQQHV
jgi:hypothetical protein